ncbi:hypothetical protein ES705_30005 [subsurface metagenome]
MKSKQIRETNELQLRMGPYKTTFVGIEIIRASTLNEWQNYGEILKRIDEAKQWAIGDWLVDGKRHYGDGLYKRAEEILGYKYQTLAKAKRLAELFEIKRRRLNLSFDHHYEVASLKKTYRPETGKWKASDEPDIDKIQEFLKRAEEEKLSVRELRDIVSQFKANQQREIELANEPEKYRIVLADPPWNYSNTMPEYFIEQGDHYSLMTIDEICALPIKKITTENSILFLWVTSPILEECFSVIKAWGFCCAIGTKILTDDLRWVNAETLKVGNRLLTFDEERRNGRRYFKWGKVLSTGIESYPCYEITMGSGKKLVCTEEHAWLMRTSLTGRESSHRWIKTNKIEKHMNHHARTKPLGISRLVPVAMPDMSYESGFLAAAFDSEGNWRKKKGGLLFAQKDNILLQQVSNFLHTKKYPFSQYANKTNDTLQLGLTGGIDNALRFMMEFRPPRLIENWLETDISKISLYNRTTDSIVAVKKIGKCDVVVLTTNTGTYFAEGFGAHNTYKSSFVWDKIKHNMGHYNSLRHELLLVCTKGSCRPDTNKLYDSVVSIERTEHSEKPKYFRELIDMLYPTGRRIEIFARKKADNEEAREYFKLKNIKWEFYGDEC